MTRGRNRGFDAGLMREAIKGPGLDTRAWGQQARVDDDDDAIVWDRELGWLVDVTMVGGELDGDGPVLCRVASPGQGATIGTHRPPRPSGLVLVQLPTGDPNDIAVIVGQLHNEDDTAGALAPTTINGDAIVERDAAEGQVAALETHIDVYPAEDLDQEWRNVRITADAMTLGAADAEQPFARGADLADALDDLADATSDVVTAISVSLAAAASPLDPTALAAFEVAVATFKAAREQYLSDRINGD